MADVKWQRYEQPPGTSGAFLRAILGRRPGLKGGATIQRVGGELAARPADPAHLRRYRELCGIVDDGFLPPAYPQVLAGALHLHILTDRAFPLKPMGIVHVRNRLEERRRIAPDEALYVTAWVEGHRDVAAGTEFDLHTKVEVDGERVWSSVITAISRSPSPKDRKPRSPPVAGEPQPVPHRALMLRVPEDIGRRYGAVTGDFNPIHVHASTARLFGFPRAIAHGMWSAARCLAELQDDLPPCPREIDVAFKRPVALPSTVSFRAHRDADSLVFAMHSRDGSTLHLQGRVTPLVKA